MVTMPNYAYYTNMNQNTRENKDLGNNLSFSWSRFDLFADALVTVEATTTDRSPGFKPWPSFERRGGSLGLEPLPSSFERLAGFLGSFDADGRLEAGREGFVLEAGVLVPLELDEVPLELDEVVTVTDVLDVDNVTVDDVAVDVEEVSLDGTRRLVDDFSARLTVETNRAALTGCKIVGDVVTDGDVVESRLVPFVHSS